MFKRKDFVNEDSIKRMLKTIDEVEAEIILSKITVGEDDIMKDFIENDFYIDDEGNINNNYVSYFYKKPSERFIDNYISGISSVLKEDSVDYLIFDDSVSELSFSTPVLDVVFNIPDIEDKKYRIEFFVDYDPIEDGYIQTRLKEIV